ncbi:MAG TPA: hypothetical protein VIN10_09500 [Bacteroidales bacterium]
MKKLIAIFAVITLFACNKTNDPADYFNLYAGCEFSVFNTQNEDLLDTTSANHLKASEIKLFYQIDGENNLVFNADMQFPKGFHIFKHENEYRIGIWLNHTETTDKPVTYIQWNENDTDTIEVIYNRTPNSIVQNKIWLNGVLVWELGENTIDPYFALIK